MNGQKLLVVSDSHGLRSDLKVILKWAKNQTIDTAIFLGDGVSDIAPAAEASEFYRPWVIVRGNNDYEFRIPDTTTLDFGGKRFFLCHGHRLNLRTGFYSLFNAAQKVQADAALFGHTHVPIHKNMNGILLINPGSIGLGRSRAGETFATIECPQGEPIKIEFWVIDDEENISALDISLVPSH